MRIARRYLITGRVQGVGFRYFAHDVASREGVHGWAKNLPDGRVEISAEGEREAMERFERQIRHGPPSARVTSVETDDSIPTGTDYGFSVR
jgi:acylphosphatase